MNTQLATNKFPLWLKALIFVIFAPLVAFGILWNVEVYISVVAWLTLPVALAFPVLYNTLPWKKTILGRALMTKARAVGLLYLIGLIGTWWPPYPFQGYLMALVVTYLAIGITFQLIVFIRIKSRAEALKREIYHGESAEEPA